MIGNIAATAATVALAVLVTFLVVPLWKLGAIFTQLERFIKGLPDEAVVAVEQGQDSLDQVNNQLERVDSITLAANRSVEDVSAPITLATATLSKPLVKVAAFSYAVRKAMGLNQEGQEEA